MTIRIASYVSILISVASLAWGYAQGGFESFVGRVIFFGGLWLFAESQRWWWFSGAGFIVMVLAASFGMLFGMPPGWMISSGVFALDAWSLAEFQRRTRYEKKTDELRALERRRLARLTAVTVAGLLLASVMMFLVRSPFTSEWNLLVAGALAIGLVQFVWRIRNR